MVVTRSKGKQPTVSLGESPKVVLKQINWVQQEKVSNKALELILHMNVGKETKEVEIHKKGKVQIDPIEV